jgi:phage terminase large subunit-like protein
MTRQPKPFTLPHFRRWSSEVILDTDEPWKLQPFQEAFVRDLFRGTPEAWLLIPEGNTKTTLMAGIALYHCEFQPYAVVPVAAASREQAEIMYRQAEGMVFRTSRLHERVHSDLQEVKGKRKLEVPRFTCLEGHRRINHYKGGRIQVFAADDRTGDGIIPTLGIIDELHRQRDLSLYRTWSGKLLKRSGQIAIISTAGDPSSDFEETRARIHATADEVRRKGSFTRVRSNRVVLHEWAVPEGEDPTDLRAVKAANPFSGITRAMLKAKFESPTMTMQHWLRFVCNRPTDDVVSWLGPTGRATWAALADAWDFVDNAPTWVGVDMALKRDTAAVVAVQERPGEWDDVHYHAKAKVWTPTEDAAIDTTDVMQYLRDLDTAYTVEAVSYDPRFFDVPARYLGDEGLPMLEYPQSIERMTKAIGGLYEAIKSGRVTHDDDGVFSTHVLGAVPRFNDRGFTLAKSKSKSHIDAAIAFALALERALRHEAIVTQEPLVAWA